MIGIMINNVKTAIKDLVQGEVIVKVSSYDVLYIAIINQGQRWNFSMSEITDQLICGVTSKEIVDFCMKAYKRYIWSLYLKN